MAPRGLSWIDIWPPVPQRMRKAQGSLSQSAPPDHRLRRPEGFVVSAFVLEIGEAPDAYQLSGILRARVRIGSLK